MLQSRDMDDVTVVIPVKNEEQNIEQCIMRLARFAHVVVLDSSSSDRTVEIAESIGVEVIQFLWDGRYPKKRNWFLLNHPPKTEWVLFLDADEFIDDLFCVELKKAIQKQNIDAYWLNYTNHFLGRELRHGVPQRKIALFRVGTILYERVNEDNWSALDMEVHEHPIVVGPIGEIKRPVQHNDFKGLSRFLNRHTDYAQWEARRYMSLMTATGLRESHLTSRQRFKYRHLARWWFPWFYFAYTYGFRLGFLDGATGLYYALYKLFYFLSVRLLISESVRTKSL